MKRIDTAGRAIDKFGAGKAGFTNGNPTTGVPATPLDESFFDHLQEELARTIEGAGYALDAGKFDQLYLATRAGFDIPFLAGITSTFTGEDLAVRTYGRVVLARPIVLLGAAANLVTAPTGAALIVDVFVNNVSPFTTKPQFAAGSTAMTAGVLNAASINVAAGSVVEFRVTQVGSTNKGQQLAFTLRAREA